MTNARLLKIFEIIFQGLLIVLNDKCTSSVTFTFALKLALNIHKKLAENFFETCMLMKKRTFARLHLIIFV